MDKTVDRQMITSTASSKHLTPHLLLVNPTPLLTRGVVDQAVNVKE